jgi:GT2 family glycosyltransferase
MDVTVVIPARNAASTISEQLDALARQIDAPEFEVVVVDNGSNDGTREVVLVHQQTFDRLRLIDEPSKLGANAARNAGVREARTTKVLMCDADDVVTPSWVRSLGDALDLDDLVGGRLDEISLNAGPATFVRTPFPTSRLPRAAGFLPYALGCNLGFRRAVWEQIGGFDESWSGGGDEVEFCWRAQLNGARVGFCPDATVQYRYRPDERGTVGQLRSYAKAEARLYRVFRSEGMARTSLSTAIKGWIWLLFRSADLWRCPEDRGAWLRRYAHRVGSLQGSLRHRVFYP